MHINIDFLAGWLSYGLFELLLTIVIVRYFPSKISSLYSIGAAIQRTFAKKPAYSETLEEPLDDLYDQKECNCSRCSNGEEQDDIDQLPNGTKVVVKSPAYSYGVVNATVLDKSRNGYYMVGTPEGTRMVPNADIAVLDAELIPEGKAVLFAVSDHNKGGGHYGGGVTFKATVKDYWLYYTIKYPKDGDVAQVEVIADDVQQLKEPEATAPVMTGIKDAL
jgi:hypothetical protein